MFDDTSPLERHWIVGHKKVLGKLVKAMREADTDAYATHYE